MNTSAACRRAKRAIHTSVDNCIRHFLESSLLWGVEQEEEYAVALSVSILLTPVSCMPKPNKSGTNNVAQGSAAITHHLLQEILDENS